MLRQAPCRLLALAVLAAAVSEPGFAAKLTDREHTRIEEPRPADVPSDEEMEAAGAVIGKIDIDVRNIFDEADPRENSGLFRIADHLHIRTKRSAIQARLLFRSGDKYSARKLAETERALRLLTYVYDAHIVPVHYADGKVDVRVLTKDVWTLSPGISFGRAGGTNATSFKLQDSNFFGWGKTVQISHESTVDRTSDTVAWSDPNVFGSRWISAAEYADSSDGSTHSLQIARPFYSLDAPWSVNLVGVRYDRTVSRYNLGKIVDQFSDDQTSYELSGGLSNGLIDGWTKRLTFGVRYDHNVFVPTATATPARELPAERTLAYPFVGFDIIEDDYKKTGDQNQIGRTEDLYFGTEVSGSIGLSNGVFGADRNALMLALSAVKGIELPAQQQIFVTGPAAFFGYWQVFGPRRCGPGPQSDCRQRREVLLALAGGLAAICRAVRNRHGFLGPGTAGPARRRQWSARISAALRIRNLAGVFHPRAAIFHRLVSVPPGARRRGRVRGCRAHLGQRRPANRPGDAAGRTGHAERRRVRLAAGQHAHRARQRAARRCRISIEEHSRNSENPISGADVPKLLMGFLVLS
jgi:hypothetical protein